MSLPEDPWDWNVGQVSHELARVTYNHTVGELILLNEVNGEYVLTELSCQSLKDDVGIVALGTRVAVMKVGRRLWMSSEWQLGLS
ncbi:hypothetical protein BGX38DRAFT_1187831 [Terfezia claveryi]|nr:hypothetical protein BGX38DRAFT_1187831 [Terfezia claveryi]